jgi:osmotically-inducible protein OsmY
MKATCCVLVFGLALLQGQADQSRDAAATRASASPTQTSSPTPGPSGTPSSGAADTSAAAGENSRSTLSGDVALQMQIQNALSREPTLSKSRVKVTALAEGIELSGSVANGRERLNAARIAQSYARGRKVLNHILVSGHGTPPIPNGPGKMNANRPATFARPAASSEPN